MATEASQTTLVKLSVFDTVAREAMRFQASGSVAMLGFFGAAASARTAVTGVRADGTALTNLLTELATKGLITDSTTAGSGGSYAPVDADYIVETANASLSAESVLGTTVVTTAT